MVHCTICKHPQRREMEIAVLKDQPVREVARQFGLKDQGALQRHFNHGHICKELRDEVIDAALLPVKGRANNLTALIDECLDISIGSAKEARAAKEYRAIGSIMSGPYKAAEILSRGSPGEGEKSGLDNMRLDLKALRQAPQPTQEAYTSLDDSTSPVSHSAGRHTPAVTATPVPPEDYVNVEDTTPGQ
jgi:hypothetical protein